MVGQQNAQEILQINVELPLQVHLVTLQEKEQDVRVILAHLTKIKNIHYNNYNECFTFNIINMKYFYILVTLLILSCKNNLTDKNDTFTLVSKSFLHFKLDDKTGFFHNSIMFSEDGNHEFFSFLNHINNSIYYYDVGSPSDINKIKLDIEGENGVGHLETISAHFFKDQNNIYIYNIAVGKLFLVNSKGNILNKYDIIDYKASTDNPFPEITALQPMEIIADDIYFPCGLNSRKMKYSNSNTVLKFNIKTLKKEYILPFSNKYDNAFYGSTFKYLPSITFNSKKIFVSFPIEHNVFGYDIGNLKNKVEFNASSEYVERKIKPFNNDVKYGLSKNRNFKKEDIFSLTTPDYQSIKYDKYRNVFYRIVHVRRTKEEVRLNNLLFSPNISIILLDSNYVKIGEVLLDGGKYHHVMIDVCKEGLAIARRDYYKKNENELVFEILKLEKK